ncbi:MAG: hypothetical protein O6848_01815 [Bacteroidetes bacterium]|nr:hypothetical protein [Bacteroidota bacterium]
MKSKLFILIVFLVILTGIVKAQSKATPEERAKYLTEVLMKDKLDLKDDQLENVNAVNLEMLQNMDEAKANNEPFSALKEYSDTRDEQLKDIFTPQQYVSFQSNLPFFRKKMNEKFGKQ